MGTRRPKKGVQRWKVEGRPGEGFGSVTYGWDIPPEDEEDPLLLLSLSGTKQRQRNLSIFVRKAHTPRNWRDAPSSSTRTELVLRQWGGLPVVDVDYLTKSMPEPYTREDAQTLADMIQAVLKGQIKLKVGQELRSVRWKYSWVPPVRRNPNEAPFSWLPAEEHAWREAVREAAVGDLRIAIFSARPDHPNEILYRVYVGKAGSPLAGAGPWRRSSQLAEQDAYDWAWKNIDPLILLGGG